jgi:hypothetical protein
VSPNKNAGFELRAIVLVLGWRHWLYKFCALCLFRLVAMERFTTEQRVLVVKTHYKYGECFSETVRKLRAILGLPHRTPDDCLAAREISGPSPLAQRRPQLASEVM